MVTDQAWPTETGLFGCDAVSRRTSLRTKFPANREINREFSCPIDARIQ